MSIILPYTEEPDMVITSICKSKFDLDAVSILSSYSGSIDEREIEKEVGKPIRLDDNIHHKLHRSEIHARIPELDSPLEVYKRRCDQYNNPPLKFATKAMEGPKKNFDASGYGMDEINIYFLNEAFSTSPITDLTKLILDYNYFGKLGCLTLATYIEESPLKHLSLIGCKIGPVGATTLAESIAKTTYLEYLNLSRCNLRDEGGAAIAKAVSKNSSIINLNLSFNKMYAEAGKEIANMLTLNNTLQVLNFKWNELYPTKNSSELIAKALIENQSITNLDLSWNGLCGKKFSKQFAKYLRKTNFLHILNMENNCLSDDELPFIIAGLQLCTSIKECYMGGNRWTNKSMAFFLVGQYESLDVFSFGDRGLESSLYELAEIFMMKPNKKIIFGGLIRPNPPDSVTSFANIIFDRIKFLATQTKKKKHERNMGHFMHLLLEQGENLIKEKLYNELYLEFNAKLDEDVARQLKDMYALKVGKHRFVDVKAMAEAYLKRHPTTKPPRKTKIIPPPVPEPPVAPLPPPVQEKKKGNIITKK